MQTARARKSTSASAATPQRLRFLLVRSFAYHLVGMVEEELRSGSAGDVETARSVVYRLLKDFPPGRGLQCEC